MAANRKVGIENGEPSFKKMFENKCKSIANVFKHHKHGGRALSVIDTNRLETGKGVRNPAFKRSVESRSSSYSNEAFSSKNINNVAFFSDFKGASYRCNDPFPDSKQTFHLNCNEMFASKSRTLSQPPYLDCKIENCCCKTFFREYESTPKVVKHRKDVKASSKSCDTTDFSVFEIAAHKANTKRLNEEFKRKVAVVYDNAAFEDKINDDVTIVSGYEKSHDCNREITLHFKRDDCPGMFPQIYENRAFNFGADSGPGVFHFNGQTPKCSTYSDFHFNGRVEPSFASIGRVEPSFASIGRVEPSFVSIGRVEPSFSSSDQMLKNFENSTYSGVFHFSSETPSGKSSWMSSKPAASKPKRMTVKSVKDRSARAEKRKRLMRESRSFGTYDNPIWQKRRDFMAESRVRNYWPITSFYVDKDDNDDEGGEVWKGRVTNLKRHNSTGFLSEETSLTFPKFDRRCSLDNLYQASVTCAIRPDTGSKLAKQRKLVPSDIHTHALFAAVEHGHLDKARTILESSDVDVNDVNSDGLSPLDVAVLSDNKPLAKLLIAHGAQEGRKFYSAEDMRNHLQNLLREAEQRTRELGSCLHLNESDHRSSFSSSSSNIPSILIGDAAAAQSKTYSIWERRSKGLRKMLSGFERMRVPESPSFVTAEVTSTSSATVFYEGCDDSKDSYLATKYRVQWSSDKDFLNLCGYYEVSDASRLKYNIGRLQKGMTYFVRVSCGNIKGFSPFKMASPACIVPTSWRDVNDRKVRVGAEMRSNLDEIFNSVVSNHPYLKSADLYGQSGGDLLVNRKKKTTIKQLFTATSKFQKHLRRGVYLSCLLYHEDKILVTNEDFLPVIEVDESFPKKISNDFHWFFKVAFSWSDLKLLRTDMEKSQNSSAVFRIKLLQAASQMQTALSIQELGKLHHKMIRDAEGTIVIPLVNYVHSPKSVSVLNLRWLPLSKLTKRTNLVNMAESNVADILMSSIPEQIAYHQVGTTKLPRGLYLGYLKMRSSVDSLQILVPSRSPNNPPHCKIRDNPHVTAEEWEWLTKRENTSESSEGGTQQQRTFLEQVAVTARRLFSYMEISDEEALNHRLYDVEIISANADVSLIMMVPPVETACSMSGHREMLLQRPDLLPLTVQIFEMAHFGTYQSDLISLYSRLSCIIEMDIDIAQHTLRKAFSAAEVEVAKVKLSELETLQAQLNVTWKGARWLLDLISYARDRIPHASPSSSMKDILAVQPKRNSPPIQSHHFLKPPDPKTAKSRGSWPGVGLTRHLGRIPMEMSRSEQQLTSDSMPNQVAVTGGNSKTTVVGSGVIYEANRGEFPSKDGAASGLKSRSDELLQHTSSMDRVKCAASFRSGDNSRGSTSDSQHSASSEELVSKITEEPAAAATSTIAADKEGGGGGVIVPVPMAAIIKVYAAYETTLPSPSGLKLHVGCKTTAKDVVETFVTEMKNINDRGGGCGAGAGAGAGGGNKEESSSSPSSSWGTKPLLLPGEFCLVSVVGARERCLRDDFKPLQMQKPWKDGRLFVRRKSDVLAAIEYNSKGGFS